MDWPSIVKSARTAFEKGVNEWILRARVKGGTIQGPNAELTPGSLSSDVNLEPTILQGMVAAGTPAQVSQVIARELGAAWNEWAAGFRMSIPGAFPGFAAFPGPQAPPTRAAQPGYPLARGTSSGEYRLQASTLQSRLSTGLRTLAGRDTLAAAKEIGRLATWVDSSFREWKASAQIIGLTGQGPVPGYAPPYVPVFPVIGIIDAHPIPITGPKFGKFTL